MGKVETTNVLLTSFIAELELLDFLVEDGVPHTLMLDRPAGTKGSTLNLEEEKNRLTVYPAKWGFLGSGTSHSKLMVLEFDDRLRVVVSSCNLEQYNFEGCG